MRQGLAAYEATGARLWRPHFLRLLANALSKAKQTEEALETARQAIVLSESTGERHSAAELHRLMGTMILKSGGQRTDAEDHFVKGIGIARGSEGLGVAHPSEHGTDGAHRIEFARFASPS